MDDLIINGANFSDGCGEINNSLSEKIANRFELTDCSAFQVRIKGAKGVVCRNPNLDRENDLIRLRQS